MAIDLLAVVVASVSAFAFGALWYSPLLFLNLWLREAKAKIQLARSPLVLLVSFFFTLLAVAAFAYLLGPQPSVREGLVGGFVVGVCLVAASMAVNYVQSGRSTVLWLIDAGFHVGRFLVAGTILGAWPG